MFNVGHIPNRSTGFSETFSNALAAPPQSVTETKTCILANMNGEESIDIPLGMDITLGRNCYHVRNLVLALLSMQSLQDPLTRNPLRQEDIDRLADHIGTSPAAFKEIWGNTEDRSLERLHDTLARTQNRTASQDLSEILREGLSFEERAANAHIEYLANSSDHHTNDRFQNLFDILLNKTAFTSKSSLLRKRVTFLESLEQNDIWASKFGRATPSSP